MFMILPGENLYYYILGRRELRERVCVCEGGGGGGVLTYLDLAVEISREPIYPVCLSDGLVTAGRRPGLHPVYDALTSVLRLGLEGTVIEHSRVRHLELFLRFSFCFKFDIHVHPINVLWGGWADRSTHAARPTWRSA